MRSPSSARASPSTATAPGGNSNETDAAARTTGSTSPARESCGAHRSTPRPGSATSASSTNTQSGWCGSAAISTTDANGPPRVRNARTKASCSRCASAASRVPSSSRRCAAAKPGETPRVRYTTPDIDGGFCSSDASSGRPEKGTGGMPSITGSREPHARTSESPTMM